jgi:L-rhamnose mutarotase
MTDIVQDQYNKLTELPTASYNILSHLIDNNENVFKLLKYDDPDALNKSDLTKIEKGELIYRGYGNMPDFKIFLNDILDDSFLVSTSVLRIYPIAVVPVNHIVSSISMAFDVYCHAKNDTLNNYTTRIDNIIHEIVKTLNGADIKNFGRLYFDRRAGSKIAVLGALPYRGKALIMCNYLLG